ncbi:hypothetical protein DICA3_D07580 [Diutina catenulata]
MLYLISAFYFPMTLAFLHPKYRFREFVTSSIDATHTITSEKSVGFGLEPIEVLFDDTAQMLYTDDDNAIYFTNLTYNLPQLAHGLSFPLLLDTGSPLTWIYNREAQIISVPTLNESHFTRSKTHVTYTYQGDHVTCSLVDNSEGYFNVGPFKLVNMTIGLTRDIPKMLSNFPVSGLIGISSKSSDTNVITRLAKQNLIGSEEFSIFLASDDTRRSSEAAGLLFLGDGSSKTKFTNETMQWYPISSTSEFWLVNLSKENQAIIDTGTTGIVVPHQDAISLHKQTFNDSFRTDGKGNFAVNCNATGKLVIDFEIGPVYVDVSSVLGNEYDSLPGVCVSKIQGADVDAWILGAAFLKSFFTTFEISRQRIGFARIEHLNRYELRKVNTTVPTASSSTQTPLAKPPIDDSSFTKANTASLVAAFSNGDWIILSFIILFRSIL